eukprot:6530299-Prymnesium_polylepis.1
MADPMGAADSVPANPQAAEFHAAAGAVDAADLRRRALAAHLADHRLRRALDRVCLLHIRTAPVGAELPSSPVAPGRFHGPPGCFVPAHALLLDAVDLVVLGHPHHGRGQQPVGVRLRHCADAGVRVHVCLHHGEHHVDDAPLLHGA